MYATLPDLLELDQNNIAVKSNTNDQLHSTNRMQLFQTANRVPVLPKKEAPISVTTSTAKRSTPHGTPKSMDKWLGLSSSTIVPVLHMWWYPYALQILHEHDTVAGEIFSCSQIRCSTSQRPSEPGSSPPHPPPPRRRNWRGYICRLPSHRNSIWIEGTMKFPDGRQQINRCSRWKWVKKVWWEEMDLGHQYAENREERSDFFEENKNYVGWALGP